jgi:tRNA(fMet)-specific endonuclease VapC
MPVRYLLDTNIASYAIKRKVPQVRVALLAVPMSEIGVSVVTGAELRFGVARKGASAHLKLTVEEFLLLQRCTYCSSVKVCSSHPSKIAKGGAPSAMRSSLF